MIKVPRVKTAKELLGNLGGVKRLPKLSAKVKLMAEGGEVEEDFPGPSAVRGSRAKNVFESAEMGSSKSMGMALSSLGEMKSEKGVKAGSGTARAQLDDVLRQLKLKEQGIKNVARGLGKNTFGAPTLEQPLLTKAALTRRSFAEGGDVSRETSDDDVKFRSMRLPGTENLPGENVRENVLQLIKGMDDKAVIATATRLSGVPFETPTQARIALEKLVGEVGISAGVLGQGRSLPDRFAGYTVGAGMPLLGGRLQGQVDFPVNQKPVGNVTFIKRFEEGGDVSRETSDSRTYLDEIEARDDPIRSGRPLQQRTRRPATLEENQAMSRAVAQGVANMPYNLLGAPGDIANLLAAPTGRQPFYGSEAVKDFATRMGVRPAPPTDPTQAALYNAADIGSALVNPAAPVRAAARGAQAVGEGLSAAAKSFQAYNRALAVPGASYAVKQKGGNWINESVEGFVEPLKKKVTSTGSDPREVLKRLEEKYGQEGMQEVLRAGTYPGLKDDAALNDWIDKKLVRYIKNEMATPEDPLLALAEREGISTVPRGPMADILGNIDAPYNRGKGGMPTSPQAVSEAGRRFENVSDASIDPTTYTSQLPLNLGVSPSELVALNRTQLRQLGGEFAVENPSARAYAMSGSTTPGDLGLDHMVDVLAEDLASGRMTVKDLNKLSMEGAARRVAEYDEEMRAAMAKAKLAQREGFPLYKAYPQGYRWHELNKPGSFAMESDAMGNSVRGYEPPKGHPDWVKESGNKGSSSYGLGGWEAIKSGKAKVYSLTDASGKSVANVEWGVATMSQPEAVAQATKEGLRGQAFAERVFNLMEGKGQPGVIYQIKGPNNLEVPDDALPFVQDFIRSQNWNKITRDWDKAGLRPASSVFNEQEMAQIRAAGIEIPNHGWLTGEEIQRMHNATAPEGSRLRYDARGNIVSDPYTRGYAHGGSVNKHDAFIKAKS